MIESKRSKDAMQELKFSYAKVFVCLDSKIVKSKMASNGLSILILYDNINK